MAEHLIIKYALELAKELNNWTVKHLKDSQSTRKKKKKKRKNSVFWINSSEERSYTGQMIGIWEANTLFYNSCKQRVEKSFNTDRSGFFLTTLNESMTINTAKSVRIV